MTSSERRADCYALAKIFSPPQKQLRRTLPHGQIAERGADDSPGRTRSYRTCIFCSTRAASIFRPDQQKFAAARALLDLAEGRRALAIALGSVSVRRSANLFPAMLNFYQLGE